MPRVKRWFPISRDIFSDPQTTELIQEFGHEGFMMWAVFLKMAEDDEGAIMASSYGAIAGSIASLARVDVERAERALRTWVKWEWVSQEWYESAYGAGGMVFRPRNYTKYHPNQSIRKVLSFSTPPRPQRRSTFTEGDQRTNQAGYIQVFSRGKWRFLHLMIVEEALEKPIPAGAIVHHVNLCKQLNVNQNLVLCQDASYHNLLHQRTYERFGIDSTGRFIRKSRERLTAPLGAATPSPPSYPSHPSEPSEQYKIQKTGEIRISDSQKQENKSDLDERIKKVADRIFKSDRKRYLRLIQWIKQCQKYQYADDLIAWTLMQCERYLPSADNWWGYLDNMIVKFEKDFNARETKEQSDLFKQELNDILYETKH